MLMAQILDSLQKQITDQRIIHHFHLMANRFFIQHLIKTSNVGINTLDLDSGEIKEIAHVKASSPNWSPDGKQILYSTHPFGGDTGGNIWIMDADGNNARQLLPRSRGWSEDFTDNTQMVT